MAVPPSKTKPDHPIEVARETLHRLAARRIAPTPANYKTLYEEITGVPSHAPSPASTRDSAAHALTGLVMDLNLHHPELATPLDTLSKAIEKSDWAQSRKLLGQIVMQLKRQADRSVRETPLPQGDSLELLRELLAKTLEFGVISQLTESPHLVDKAQRLANSVREAHSAAALRTIATDLKPLWVGVELQAVDAQDKQEMLKVLLLLLVENIGELLDDDTWLRGQIAMVQEVIAGPLKVQSLYEAEKRLKEVIYKQSMVKHGLHEATLTLKTAMTTFVSRMKDAVATTDDYQDKIANHIERISNTNDVLELNNILESLLEEARASQTDTRRVHDQLVRERDAAVQAEARIKQLETQITEMSALVREDPLTHSLNRRGLDDEFMREASRADRHKAPFSIALIDIDNFKVLNDKRGHQAGDDALIHLVNVTKEALRVTDHVARIGGEEFLILLPNTGLTEAEQTLVRLQRSLTKKYFLDKKEHVLITFSAGVAERVPGEAQEAAIARADAAMYLAKQTGKNRVCVAPPPTDLPQKK